MTDDAERQELGPPRQGWRSRLKSHLHAISRPLRVAILVLIAGLAILTLALSAKTFLGIRDRVRDQGAREEQARLFDRVRDRVDSLGIQTFKGAVSLKMKYASDGIVQYQFLFTPDAGLYIADFSYASGYVTLQLLDRDGFLVHSETLKEFTRVVDPADSERRCIGLKCLGAFRMPLDSFVRITQLYAPHTLNLERLPLAQLPTPDDIRFISDLSAGFDVGAFRAEQAKKDLRSADSATNQATLSDSALREFEHDLNEWDARSAKIRIGMTYQEMVAAAGSPRTKTYMGSDEWAGGKYDLEKYNYGRKWVYFKDSLVVTIR